jgi:ribosomal protein L2
LSFCSPPASLTVGNVLPVGSVPEGTILCNVEERNADRGALARASGRFATVLGHTDKGTQLKLPSGKKKVRAPSFFLSLYLKDLVLLLFVCSFISYFSVY